MKRVKVAYVLTILKEVYTTFYEGFDKVILMHTFTLVFEPGRIQIKHITFFNFYDKIKLIVVVLGPVIVGELISVEAAHALLVKGGR